MRSFLALAISVIVSSTTGANATDSNCVIPDFIEFAAVDAQQGASFGANIDADGNLAVVGAPYDVNNGIKTGAVYVFQRDGIEWQQIAKLVPNNGIHNQEFGISAAIEGGTIVVGSRLPIVSESHLCAAYVFRPVDGDWQQVALLTNSLGYGNETSRINVAIHGDTVAIGCPQSANRGAVFLFREVGDIWLPIVIPSPIQDVGNIYFGNSIALSDDRLFVGAPHSPNYSDVRTGVVYTYYRTSSGGWTPTSILTANDGMQYDWFGESISIENDTLVIGAILSLTGTGPDGAAYVFRRNGSQWQQSAKLTSPIEIATSGFAADVSIAGNTIAVGVQRLFSVPTGAVMTFRNDGSWQHDNTLAPSDEVSGDDFGYNVAMAGDILLAGAPEAGIDVNRSGSVYAVDLATLDIDCNANGISDVCDILSTSSDCNGNGVPDDCDIASELSADCDANGIPDECDFVELSAIAELTSSDGTPNQKFGWSVDLSGDTAVIGAVNDNAFGHRSGAAYVFRNNGGAWQEHARLVASDAAEGDRFGASVSISGATVVIGAYGEGGDSSGAAYVFEETSEGWQEVAKLTPSDPASSKAFGYCVATQGDTAIIGAYGDSEIEPFSGAVYVFRKSGGSWQQIAKLKADDATSNQVLGQSLALDGDTLVIGAPATYATVGTDRSAYIFREIDGVWQQTAKLIPDNANATDSFGISVDIHSDTIIVGAARNNLDDSDDQAAAFIFREFGGAWHEIAMLANNDSDEDGSYGSAVGISGDNALIGSAFETATAPGAFNRMVYAYRETNGEWRRIRRLTRDNDSTSDHFGGSIAIEGSTALIGAAWAPASSPAGAAFTFDLSTFIVPGDLNNDNLVDMLDAAILVNVLLEYDTDALHVARADVNCSGNVDGRDLQQFVTHLLAL